MKKIVKICSVSFLTLTLGLTVSACKKKNSNENTNTKVTTKPSISNDKPTKTTKVTLQKYKESLERRFFLFVLILCCFNQYIVLKYYCKGVDCMANVNIRIDDNVKKEAEAIFNELGLTPTAAITLFYKQVIRTYSIPFEIKLDMPNKDTKEAIKEVEDYESKLKNAKTYYTVNELIEGLKK